MANPKRTQLTVVEAVNVESNWTWSVHAAVAPTALATTVVALNNQTVAVFLQTTEDVYFSFGTSASGTISTANDLILFANQSLFQKVPLYLKDGTVTDGTVYLYLRGKTATSEVRIVEL